MGILSLRGILLFLCAFLNLLLAFFLLQKSKNNRKDVFYLGITALFSGFYAFVSGATYFFWNPDSSASLFWYRLTWLGVLMMPPFEIFTYYFTKNIKGIKIKAFFFYLGAAVISFFALFTPLFIKSVRLEYPNIAGITGPLDIFGRLYIFFCLIIFITNFLKEYSKSAAFRRLQIKYFILGIVIYAISGFIFTGIIPVVSGESAYFDILAYSSLIWVGLISYAILKNQLFDIKVVAVELLTYAIWIFVLVRALLSDNLQEGILNAGLLVFLIISGILLIRGVLREVKTREEMERLAEGLEKANARLKKLDEAKSEFVSIASHQLRTPLTSIKGLVSMALEDFWGPLNENQRKYLGQVYQSGERLLKLIEDLLDISRIEAGRENFDFQPVDLEKIIEEVVRDLVPQAEKKGIILRLAGFDNPLLDVKADSLKIRQVVQNLIDNAIKYTSSGEITVRIEPENNFMIFSVKDSGEGISKEDQVVLFEKFQRGKGAVSRHTEGTGLGLYLASKIVDAHGGKIWVKSEGKGKGSTFFFSLPMIK